MPETTKDNILNPEYYSTIELITADININPDARLIQACEEYCAAEAMFRSFFPGAENAIEDDNAREAAQRPYRAIQADLMEIIADVDCRATTLEGMRARARAAVAWAQGDGPSLEGQAHEIVARLLNDLLGSGVYQPKHTKLSSDVLASPMWLKATGKIVPSYVA